MKPISQLLSARFTLAWLGFLGTLTVYFGRLDMSMALVSMVKHQSAQSSYNAKNASTDFICQTDANSSVQSGDSLEENFQKDGDFEWSPGAQGSILASYYYGYIWTQAVGPWLATRIGYKKVWTIAMFFASIMTLLTPSLAWFGYYWLFAGRIILGLCHGVTFPVMHGMIGIWAPPLERSKLISIYVSGASVGTCVLFPIAGLLIDAFGWPSVFYFTGVTSLIWCVLWTLLAFDSPDLHPRISKEELAYIEESRRSENNESEDKCIPWRQILLSKPVWAVTAGHLASNWGNYQLNSLLPTYLATVLRFVIL